MNYFFYYNGIMDELSRLTAEQVIPEFAGPHPVCNWVSLCEASWAFKLNKSC